MEPDGKYDLEYKGALMHPVSESRGPELTAFMLTGMGVFFPDLALAASNITISTNNVNALSKITMDCTFTFSKLYGVSLDWALGQLQAAFRANKPSPFQDLHFHQPALAHPQHTKPMQPYPFLSSGTAVGKKRGRKSNKEKEALALALKIPLLSGTTIAFL